MLFNIGHFKLFFYPRFGRLPNGLKRQLERALVEFALGH
jgi:hypothetical protein